MSHFIVRQCRDYSITLWASSEQEAVDSALQLPLEDWDTCETSQAEVEVTQ
jgi:hypothetical protein